MSRRLAREYAIQFLYSLEYNKDENMEQLLEEFFETQKTSESISEDRLTKKDKEFFNLLVDGTNEQKEFIDKKIMDNSLGWQKERIAKVDLSILRLGVFELFFVEDIPESVTANEAIEMAKRFSTEESSSFINGIIGKIIRDKNIQSV